ncbi:hypothetical protein [Planococcus halotolerans]|uniref:YhfM-like domain-containing protein n=1 Tax=Planococcus halotolerans TaxID=2233542 RepID=A0A365L7A0_9BACL|nr:hypothetical protein [Planococcus halotolerans]RAZ81269.1 hypothetical protein DP120_02995 [Planococcus halotolerans]
MKRVIILLLFTLMATVLFGCQPEKAAVEVEEAKNGLEAEELLAEGEIAKVELSEVKGVNPLVYDDTDELEIFRDLFSSADKEPGIVNMGDPEFYLKVIMEDGEKRYLNLWLGGEGETASLMNIEDTHTVYTVEADIQGSLAGLINK